jgi:hypothetical protein
VTATLTDDGVFTISGEGKMDDYTYNGKPWYSERTSITSIVIESGVTSIGDYAFYETSNLTSIVIPDKVTSIGDYAFSSSGLETVIINGDVTIGDYAFAYCTPSLTSVTINGGDVTIGDYAFYETGNMISIVIPDKVTSIGEGAFYYCTATSVTVTGGLGDDGKTIPDGIINKYFKDGMDWKLLGMSASDATPIKYLILRDISSSDYNPGSQDGKGGIAGDTGRILFYSDSVFSVSSEEWEEAVTYSVSGTMTVTGGYASEANVTVTLTPSSGPPYTAKTGDGGKYEIPHVLSGTTGNITAGIEGHTQNGMVSVTDLSGNETEKDLTLEINKYSASGTITVTGGSISAENVTVSLISSSDPDTVYLGTVKNDGTYTVPDVPYGTTGNITATLTGYHQTDTAPVTDLKSNETDNNINLEINEYTVTLNTEETEGVSGFEYSINGSGTAVPYTEPFAVNHGDTLTVTALLSEGYVFKEWSMESEENPLEISSVSGKISLTAYASLIPVPPSPSDTYYYITFSSGSYYTVYAENSSPISSSSIPVMEGESLTFGIQASEGYTVYPSVVSGTAGIILQTDGWYKMSNIRSDIRVNIAVNTVSGDDPYGNGTDNGTGGNGSGGGSGGNYNTDNGSEGNGSDTDSGNSNMSYWVPAVMIAVFLSGIAAALAVKFGLFGIKLFGK